MAKKKIVGGKGNIKPEDGKQFSSTYQPPEKWTEEKALELGNDIIHWMNIKEDKQGHQVVNIFFEEYLLENGYYNHLITYLCKKFTSFLQLIEGAKQLQKIRLIKYGVYDRFNASMTKFVLVNNHGMADKKETVIKDQEETVESLEAELKELQEREDRLRK